MSRDKVGQAQAWGIFFIPISVTLYIQSIQKKSQPHSSKFGVRVIGGFVPKGHCQCSPNCHVQRLKDNFFNFQIFIGCAPGARLSVNRKFF